MDKNQYNTIPRDEDKYYYKPHNNIEYREYISETSKNTFLDENKIVFRNEYFEKLEKFYRDTTSNDSYNIKFYNENLIPFLKSKTISFEKHKDMLENIEKLTSIIDKLNSEINYSKSLFSLCRTLIFYIDIPNINFFSEEDRNILGVNIQKKQQSLTIEFSSESVIHYSYACNEREKGLFRMTGRAKLTKFLQNSHFITKIINSIR